MELFEVHVPVAELILRGTLVYWLLFLIFRFVLRRDVGAVGIADILLLVIVADAAQNAMSGGYDTFSEGAILVLTIVAWNWLLDFLSYRFALVRRFASPGRLTLIRPRRGAAPQPAARIHHHGRAAREVARAGHREPRRREGRLSRRRWPDQRHSQPGEDASEAAITKRSGSVTPGVAAPTSNFNSRGLGLPLEVDQATASGRAATARTAAARRSATP